MTGCDSRVVASMLAVETMNVDPEERLLFLRTSHLDILKEQLASLDLNAELVPTQFLETLNEKDKTTCYRATLLCYTVCKQVPREMQLRTLLADVKGKDCLVSAGTGSGKTLPIALKILLDDPTKNLITLTLSPFKRLQKTQETDFTTRYQILTAVINEDTPRDDTWWSVSCHGKNYQIDFFIVMSRKISGTIKPVHQDELDI